MFGIFKIKALLLGSLLASPAVAMWKFRSSGEATAQAGIHAVSYQSAPPSPASVTRVPVEVIAKGSAPQWVYVQVENEAIPEPGMISLLALTGLLLAFRRQRR
ncbi:MAG: PEP-CTERM sorting domain-containing protein [Verrucomicrobiota bacterium]